MKKLISLVLVAVLALSLATAYAVPSKTTNDLTKVLEIETTGEKPADDFAIVIVEDSEAAKAELEKIIEFVKDGKAPAEYFPAELLPENASELEMNEFVGIAVLNYKPEYGDVTAKLEFGTPYNAGQKVYPLTSIDGEWTSETAEAQEDGAVKITFTAEQLQKMAEAANIMAVLSEPAAK